MWLLLTHTGDPDLGDFGEVINDLADQYNSNQIQLMTDTVSLLRVDATWFLGTGDLRSVIGRSDVGAVTADPVNDAGASVCGNWAIAASYRGGHPRNYYPGVPGNQVDNGSDIHADFLTDWNAALVAFLSNSNSITEGSIGSCTVGTVSFQTAGAWRTPPIFRPYIGAFTDPTLASQRRRIHG